MMRALVLVLVGLLLPLGLARAIEEETTPVTYNETTPTNANITNWTSGWVQPAVQPTGYTSTTGWNYCGSVGGNSAVYLGYGWVLTAAHVGSGGLNLNNVTYPMVANSAQILNSVQVPGQAAPTQSIADLVIFKVSPCPALPPLTIRPNDPVLGSEVAMFGYGHTNGDRVPTWGFNTILTYKIVSNGMTFMNSPLHYQNAETIGGVNYYSDDFLTVLQDGSTNNYEVVVGDSGGPDFIYNSTTKAWELAGINEALLGYQPTGGSAVYLSACVELNTYLPQINAIMAAPPSDTPAMPKWAMSVLVISLATLAAIPLAARDHLPSKALSKG